MFFNGFKIKIFLLKLGHKRVSDKNAIATPIIFATKFQKR